MRPRIQTEVADGMAVFATTHWSVVLQAGSDSPRGQAALESLCRTYWYAIYAYLRRRGYRHEDAQDLTQGFLLQLLERRSLSRVAPEKGRFRSFLLTALNYYLSDQRDRDHAQKRGQGQPLFSLDAQAAAERYRLEPADPSSPDRLFERRWALAMLDQVLVRLEGEFQNEGKAVLFHRLRGFLVMGPREQSYAETAAELGMSEAALRKAVQRLRNRYYEVFRDEIAQTLADPAEMEDELRYLCGVIAG